MVQNKWHQINPQLPDNNQGSKGSKLGGGLKFSQMTIFYFFFLAVDPDLIVLDKNIGLFFFF